MKGTIATDGLPGLPTFATLKVRTAGFGSREVRTRGGERRERQREERGEGGDQADEAAGGQGPGGSGAFVMAPASPVRKETFNGY